MLYHHLLQTNMQNLDDMPHWGPQEKYKPKLTEEPHGCVLSVPMIHEKNHEQCQHVDTLNNIKHH